MTTVTGWLIDGAALFNSTPATGEVVGVETKLITAVDTGVLSTDPATAT
jgi:hypothetical protein